MPKNRSRPAQTRSNSTPTALATDPPDLRRRRREADSLELVKQVKQSVNIPVAVKLSPVVHQHSATWLRNWMRLGADGVVLFNRFYQPDFDIENLDVVPSLHFSTSEELLLRLHWTAILYSHIKADIAITGGVHSAEDVLKSMMAGAQVAMVASALHVQGIDHLDHASRRSGSLDDGTRIRVRPPDARQPQPPFRAGYLGIRTRKLHQDSQLLHAREAYNSAVKDKANLLVYATTMP